VFTFFLLIDEVNALRAIAHSKRATGKARPLPFFWVNWRTSRVSIRWKAGGESLWIA
jgi:hypothetical protein